MTTLAREVQNVQNPALGAALIWRFCCAFVDASAASDHPKLPLTFLVLPVVMHDATAELLHGTQTRSGLRAFAAKFSDSKSVKQDLLLQLNDRVLRWKILSLQSLDLASAGGLIRVTEEAEVVPMSTTPVRGVSDDVRQLVKGAEKLGRWCGQLTTHEIANTLRVRL